MRALAVLALGLAGSGCGNGDASPATAGVDARPCPGVASIATGHSARAASYAHARSVLARHRRALIAQCHGANGSGIALADQRTRARGYAIVVTVRSESDRPDRGRWSLAGVPLVFRVVGDISAQ